MPARNDLAHLGQPLGFGMRAGRIQGGLQIFFCVNMINRGSPKHPQQIGPHCKSAAFLPFFPGTIVNSQDCIYLVICPCWSIQDEESFV
jgi:AICAR transformylase/IMP cyclohydrolase PurH